MQGSLSKIGKYHALSFRRLREEDFLLLHDWLNQPHVRDFYQQQAINLLEIRQKYTPRLQSDSTIHCFIICCDRIPIGYIQTYLIEDCPDYAAVIGGKDGVCIDLYIGEKAFLKQGLGYLIELKFLRDIAFQISSADKCYVSHAKVNLPALKTSRKAGFLYLQDVVEDNQINELFVITKEQVLLQIDSLLDGAV